MSIDIVMIIMAVIGIFLSMFIGVLIVKLLRWSFAGILTSATFILVGAILSIIVSRNLLIMFTEDYDDVEVISTYKIFDMSSIDENTTLINYLDDNKELKHVKSDKVRIFYDLKENEEPYLRKLEYKRLFIKWNGCEVHIRE